MQRLDFNDEGKLVAYTDNGCTDGKSATTELKGTFDVSADVVKFILAKEYELPATLGIEWEKGEKFGFYTYNQRLYCYIGNDEQQRELESYRHEVDEKHKLLQEYRHRLEELSNVENELKRLRKAIDDFNRTRRFYERKIKV